MIAMQVGHIHGPTSREGGISADAIVGRGGVEIGTRKIKEKISFSQIKTLKIRKIES
jgi:hypothetical protein